MPCLLVARDKGLCSHDIAFGDAGDGRSEYE